MKNQKSKLLQYLILLFMCPIFSTYLVGQRVELGLRLMPTITSTDFHTSSGGKITGEATLGYGIGGLLAFNFTDHIGVQGEVIYNSLSQKYKEQDVERQVKLKYLNIPLLLTLNSNKSRLVNFNAVFGPQIGISIGSKLETSGQSGLDSTKAILAVRKGDLGLAYGAGLDIALTPSHSLLFNFGYRGILGLFDISDDSQTLNNGSYFILDKAHVNTNALYIGVSLAF
ncbi:MAG: porin family protein [Saprospiraceae bacterium]